MPVTNAVLIAVTSIAFFFVALGVIPEDAAEAMVLKDWDLGQMIGNLFLHGGLFHLLGNMLFLWIFGNAVCALVGNVQYGFLYLFLGIVASASHLAFNGNPAIGASGAINGIVGMSLVLFPVNKLNCVYFYSFPFAGIFWKSGTFTAKAFWMILLWCTYDIIGVLLGGGNIAYWAHIGGFVAGMFIALALLLFKAVETYDTTLVDILMGKTVDRETYDMDELAERIRAKKKKEQILLDENYPEATPVQNDIGTEPAEPAKEPIPILRVLKTARRQTDVYVYFINEGDKVNNVAVESKDTIIAEFSPTTLPPKSPGWMKISNAEESVLQNINLFISYEDGEGRRSNKQMNYDGSGRRFFVAQ